MTMNHPNVAYSSLVEALRIVFGQQNTDLIIRHLEQENVIRDGIVNSEEIEPALKSLFGQGVFAVLNALLLAVQKKSERRK